MNNNIIKNKINKIGNTTKFYNNNNINNDKITSIISNYFHKLNSTNKDIKYIINTPSYSITNDKLTIKFVYYCTSIKMNKNIIVVDHLSNIISKIENKDISIIINRIYYPYIDSIIFAKYLSHNSNFSNYLNYQDSIQININIIKNNLPSNIARN